MMVLYEAPLQMLCDSPTNYEKNRECLAFMAKVPTVWRETRGLAGTPDTCAACARRAPDGAWYAACITTLEPRDYALDTAFLGAGEWTAEIFRDAPDADRSPERYVRETRRIRGGDVLNVRLASGGGFAIRFSPR
jgi:alpha-glucosidase